MLLTFIHIVCFLESLKVERLINIVLQGIWHPFAAICSLFSNNDSFHGCCSLDTIGKTKMM